MKKKILIYLAGMGYGCSNGQHLDMAIDEIAKGNEVFVLGCDGSLGLCMDNPGANPIGCKFCEHCRKNDVKNILPNCNYHWIKEYIKRVDKTKLPKLQYKDAKELRALEYEGIMIGFGVMSSYISLTRNLNPLLDKETRRYMDALIEEQLVSLEVMKILQEENHFDLVIFQNGRGAQFKPILNYCQTHHIDFWCTEDYKIGDKTFTDNYWCDIPHSIAPKCEKYVKCWDTSKESPEDREKRARSFFENRKNAKVAGDKVYVKDQVKGMMPEDWDENKENIVFFNSSEDEFCAVSKEFDAEKLFPSQMEGIIAIVEHYKNDPTKHFTLRVHPNLMKIPYKYHTDLYKLDYPNLTVIPGNSPVSTYTLMDAADKVLVFGSTTGIEASYWGKPVICMAGCFYRDFDVVYQPRKEEDLWKLIETKNLPCKYNDKALYYGYFYMSDNHPRTKHVDFDVYFSKLKYKGKSIHCLKHSTFLGSNFLYAAFDFIFRKKGTYMWPAKFRYIPRKEE